MKILLVYPEHPETFWSFKYALKFISRKATEPPLGLLTVAAMLPKEWEKRLVDMKVTPLKDKDIEWADFVFISGMSIQKTSAREVIARCKEKSKKIVAGGPLFTTESEEFDEVDHLVLNEAENTLPAFLKDLENGCAKHIYTSSEFPPIENTPAPLWKLLNLKKYATMDIQFSRGCPFNCEFCDIVQLYGRKVRTKSKEQIVNELATLYSLGWRHDVFFVDDNFIGNTKKLKREILPAIIEWMEKNGRPFTFGTEASINLADDEELMKLMVQAGFDSVFVGIETVNEESLAECNKSQNKKRDLAACVKKIQNSGLMVKGGFILGFDNDPPTIFDNMIEFIQESQIVSAMVGLLNAPRGTKLYKRLDEEGRLLKINTGNNTDFSINFIPKMDYEKLIRGYRDIIKGIYSPKPYYDRVIKFLKTYDPLPRKGANLRLNHLSAFVKSIFVIGIIRKERWQYWKLFFWTIFRRPRLFPLAITLSIYGVHFQRVYDVML
jgi:radical SAM superfamily enzyme YgiQ (UPF0313 family)